MKHLNQNCGSSCGPTSLRMIMSAVGYREELGIQDIFDMSPTRIGGTPWPRMHNIIKRLGIKHRVMAETPLNYFLQNPDKVWMLAVYYGNIKHWVVLKTVGGKFIVYDPADTVKEYGYKELYNIYECRNSLAIEFDLSDFLGQSNDQTTRDDDGDYVMDHVNENQMVLIEDSNFIFGKKGRRVMTTEEIYEADFEEDYIYGIFSNSEILYKDFIFARSGEKTILLRFR